QLAAMRHEYDLRRREIEKQRTDEANDFWEDKVEELRLGLNSPFTGPDDRGNHSQPCTDETEEANGATPTSANSSTGQQANSSTGQQGNSGTGQQGNSGTGQQANTAG